MLFKVFLILFFILNIVQNKTAFAGQKSIADYFSKDSTQPIKKTTSSVSNISASSTPSPFITDASSEFRLKDYKHAANSPARYRLALLDKSAVVNNILEDDPIPEEIRPFIHTSAKTNKKSSLECKTFPERIGFPKHFIVQLKRRKSILRAAFLTNELFTEDEPNTDDKIPSPCSSEEPLNEEEEQGLSSSESNPHDSKDKITSFPSEEDMSENEEFEASSSSRSGMDKGAIASLLHKEEDTDEDEIGLEDEVESDSQSEGEYLEYAASIIFFPVIEDTNKMLAYLLGNWSSLLNTTSLVPLFGLKFVTSYGVTSTLENRNLRNIKEITKETHRKARPIRGVGKQQKSLGAMEDFEIDAASEGLEKVRLKPVESWGKALLDGDDFFRFRLLTKSNVSIKNKKPEKLFTKRHAMYEVAKEVYRIYTKNAIREDFKPYLDEPVIDEGTIASLNGELAKNWEQYKKDHLIYPHWTVWSHLRGGVDIVAILKSINKKGYEGEISIRGQTYKKTQFIRSLPIPFPQKSKKRNDYYWFDRGAWYQIHAARFEVIRKRINEITMKQEELCLPNYKVDADSKDYKELAYNKAAVEAMRAQMGPNIAEAILLDRELVSLGTGGNKFEFADILMQNSDEKYFLIHLKRGRAKDFDHHRTQAERSALFLGENLDRGALPGLLIAGILQDFYKENINLPKEKKPDDKGKIKETEQPWSSGFREKFDNKRKEEAITKSGKKRKRKEEFFERIFNDILNVRIKERVFIKKIISSSDEFKTLIPQFEPYEDSLCRCFDALEDYYLYGSKKINSSEEQNPPTPERIKFVRDFLNKVLELLKKHPTLAKKHQGILPYKARDNIIIVLGIIQDDYGKNEFYNQRLWGIEETRKLVTRQGFAFRVVFIKDETDKTINNDKDGSEINCEDKKSENDGGNGNPLFPSSLHSLLDGIDVENAKQEAAAFHSKDAGYKGVLDTIYYDESERPYVCVELDGTKGDCCFHALGISREGLIEKLKSYIEDHEENLMENLQRVNNSISLRNICNPLLTTAENEEASALRGYPLSNWNSTIAQAINDEEKKSELNMTFNVLLEQQGADPVDWTKVLTNAQRIKDVVDDVTSGDNDLIHYKEFLGKCKADLWKKVGDDNVTSAIEAHLIKRGICDTKTKNILKPVSDDDLNFSNLKPEKEQELGILKKKKPRKEEEKLKKKSHVLSLTEDIKRLSLLDKEVSSQKLKNYVKDSIRFLGASAQTKKDILHNFYITNGEWLDPCAIMHVGPYFGFKAKLFRNDDSSFPQIRLDAQTPNADVEEGLPCRLMLFVSDNHYNLLFPIPMD